MPQPKAYKYKRKQRLIHAKSWIKKYNGKRIHHGYAKHFGVNKLCAVMELELLGIELPQGLKEDIIRSEIDKKLQLEKLKLKKELNDYCDSDYNFAFIAGYTPCGFPYGITWEEMENYNDDENEINKALDEELPF